MARSRRDENRAIRQEALREQLSNQGHLQHVVDCIEKIELAGDKLELDKLKVAIDSRLKLINKYLPDIKQVEADVNTQGELILTWGKPYQG